MLNNFLLQIK